jgi:hypothetical protein
MCNDPAPSADQLQVRQANELRVHRRVVWGNGSKVGFDLNSQLAAVAEEAEKRGRWGAGDETGKIICTRATGSGDQHSGGLAKAMRV